MSAPVEPDDVGRALGLEDSSQRRRRIRLRAIPGFLVAAAAAGSA